jgi:hypothetical protein
MNKLLIDVKQLSESTGLSVFTLYSWINQKRIPYAHLSPEHKKAALDTLGKRLTKIWKEAS